MGIVPIAETSTSPLFYGVLGVGWGEEPIVPQGVQILCQILSKEQFFSLRPKYSFASATSLRQRLQCGADLNPDNTVITG